MLNQKNKYSTPVILDPVIGSKRRVFSRKYLLTLQKYKFNVISIIIQLYIKIYLCKEKVCVGEYF